MSQNTSNDENTASKVVLSDQLLKSTGKLSISLLNDYMFRATFQENPKALEGLVCSLMHLHPTQIVHIEITNPIELGKTIGDKEYRLDLKILLNNGQKINIELQVANENNWTNRSLVYLCREFDDLQHGEDYNSVKPTTHISILDFTLFKDAPEFYALYRMMSVSNHQIYNPNFMLNVLDLNQIPLATQEDKQYNVDKWAELFKATTWEEIKMLSKENEFLAETSNTLNTLSQDRQIYYRCKEREEILATQRNKDRKIEEQQNTIMEMKDELAQKEDELAQKEDELAQKDDMIAQQEMLIKQLQEQLANK